MAKQELFEYTVIYHPRPTKDQREEGVTVKSVLLVAPVYELANSEREITIKASQQIPAEYMDKLDCVDVIVRPF